LHAAVQRETLCYPLFPQVVTDFTTCHNTWFHKHTTRCFVPTEFCAKLARDNGLEDGQIIQHGAHC
jgi:1,2-diacylglycerol 3-beta-galactosyltransferase